MGTLRRLALIGILGATPVVVGGAASLSQASASLGAATTSTPRCTSTALAVTPVLSGSNVVSVTVASIPSTCGGATLQVAFFNGSTTATGSTAVPGAGGSVTVTLSAATALASATRTDLLFIGP
jgi:hypothetical protein